MQISRERALEPHPTPGPGSTLNTRTQYAGWDERFNFAQMPYLPENGYVMRALYVQAAGKIAELADAINMTALSDAYRDEQKNMTAIVKACLSSCPNHDSSR